MKKRDGYGLGILKALEFFINYPYQEIHLREFARKMRISPNTANRFLDKFVEEGIVVEERKANLRYFKANLNSNFFRQIKIAYSIKEIENSSLVDYLREKTSHIVLFGSVAEGKNDAISDIDLLIIGDKKKINEIIFKCQEKLNKEVNAHIFSWVEWKKQAKINKAFYQDIIAKGINLIGEKPVVE